MRRMPGSLRTIEEFRTSQRRALMIRRLVWVALIVGIVGVVAIPCDPLAGYAC